MTAVVFETPGLIDVRAFTIMGAHAKPNSTNPIGYFGTGLKYALAVLVRLGCEPVIWIGRNKFTFYSFDSKFRGEDLSTIRMRVKKDGSRSSKVYELPFTTQYGKNWKAWQAYRELESNTIDEKGQTYDVESLKTFEDAWNMDRRHIGSSFTGIFVDLPEFTDAWLKRDEIFLPGASREAKGILEAFPGEGNHLYYRGMKVYDLGKPSLFTYNIVSQQELTEDRTLKYEFYAKRAVAEWVVKEASANQVERIVKAKEEDWEFGLEFPSHIQPSDAFKEVMTNRRKPAPPPSTNTEVWSRPHVPGPISRNAYTYFAPVARALQRERPRTVTYEAPWRLTDAHPRPWKLEGLEVHDSNGNAVFAAPEGYYDDWEKVAEALINRVNVSSLRG